MKSKLNFVMIIICLIGTSAFSQTTYSSSINALSPQNYSVNIEIVLTGIVPTQGTCDWGYNYDIAYDYDIEIIGSSSNLYTLSGYLTCGSNQGIYFDLPNSGGSGSDVTQGNPWNNNSDCATATVESLECNSIDLVIEGEGIPNQTITLEPTNEDNENDSEWDTNGNSCDTTAFIGTVNQADLRFRTNNIEQMRLTNDGKFGVGVTNPLEKFELQGNFKLSGDAIFSDYADVNDSLGKFLFIDQNGRTSPKSLDQLKNIFYAAPIGEQPATLCDIGLLQQNPTWSNGPNKLYSLCPDVNVGIGTNDPQKLLDVRGTTQTRRLQVGREPSAYAMISGFRTGISNTTILSLGNFNPQTQTEHKVLELSSSGEFNLNYNSAHPGATHNIFTISNENRKLLYLNANNATLYARRIIVDQQTWSDYVFAENYELLPLTKVKQYIDDNGHLPNVPSEKEVTQEGVDLAEMNRILLEKIEELTLYTIQQQEEIEKLKEKVQK